MAAIAYSTREPRTEPSILKFQLSILAVGGSSPSTGWTLQQNANSDVSVNSSKVTSGIQDSSTENFIIVNLTADNRFYRSKWQP